MTEFSKERSELFNRFISYRTACGLWNNGYEMNLLYFDRFCSENFPGICGLTQSMIDGWCVQRDTESKSSLICRTLSARKLVEYLNERQITNLTIPKVPSMPAKNHIPHTFTDDELQRFFKECDIRVVTAKDKKKRFRALEITILFRLLYSTGMRTTEVRLLRPTDVDLSQKVINIRKSKNTIEHYVALHETLIPLLTRYEEIAEMMMPYRSVYFPSKEPTNPLSADTLTWEFHKVWDSVNITKAVPYDFRHNYAIRNINSWLEKGFEFNDKFLYLSKSMGHTSLESTKYYYSIVPALANIIEQLSGDGFDEIIPEVPDEEE